VCFENELVIATWSPVHLRTKLKELYWKEGQPAAEAMAFWEDTLRYLYLPRLKDRDVLSQAIRTGASSRDFFGTAYGQQNGKFDGFQLGSGSVQVDDTLLLIEPETAKSYEKSQQQPAAATSAAGGIGASAVVSSPTQAGTGTVVSGNGPASLTATYRPRSFHGSADVPPATAKMRLVQLAEEIVAVLGSDPNASLKVTIEISAEYPDGASDTIKRAVSENARSLGLKTADWE
jgi:hypothetical protein